MIMLPPPRYALVQRVLHWVIALCVLGLLCMGATFGALGYEGMVKTFGDPLTNTLYMYHKSFGVVVLGLMLLRVFVRVNLGAPPYRTPLDPMERIASASVHGLLYVALIAQPLVGWAATAAGGYPVEFFGTTLPGLLAKDPALSERLYRTHGLLGWALLVLVALHVAGAVRHWQIKRDGVMDRISLP